MGSSWKDILFASSSKPYADSPKIKGGFKGSNWKAEEKAKKAKAKRDAKKAAKRAKKTGFFS